jgi:hypothetical protein
VKCASTGGSFLLLVHEMLERGYESEVQESIGIPIAKYLSRGMRGDGTPLRNDFPRVQTKIAPLPPTVQTSVHPMVALSLRRTVSTTFLLS